MIATLSADRAAVTLQGDSGWSEIFPVTDLPAKLAFYRTLRDRGAKGGAPGTYARFYEPSVKALERVAKMMEVMR